MNDTTDNNTESTPNKLQGAFGDRGTNVNSGMVYGHPHGESIINDAKAIIRESKTGRLLLVMLDKNLVPVHIMKGNGSNGFSPDMGTIILQIPSSVSKVKGEHVIQLIKAMHEAAQERAGFKAPKPHDDIMAYASFIHGRNLDSIVEVCKIVKELTNSSFYSVLLDSLKKIGLYNVYNAYLDGKDRDSLYTEYAEAYQTL